MKSNPISRSVILLGCWSLVFFGAVAVDINAHAETTKAKKSDKDKEEEPLPQSGVLSRSMSGGTGDAKVSIPWGKQKNAEGTEAPISGSVSRQSPKEWVMRVSNSSEDTYSVNLRVVQFNAKGEAVKTDSFSYRLKGGEKAERTVSAALNTADAQLKLESWKNLTPKKEEPTPAPQASPNARAKK